MTPPNRVLLVDDNDLNRTLVRTILARSNHPAATAVDLIEADSLATARAALTEPVKLVLLDLQLPDGDGLTLARDLANGPAATRPVIIAVTGQALPEQLQAALAAGCTAILTKPFLPRQIIELLDAHLDTTATH
jgi:two-component system, OmpR family, KDP operon response regulator KdpE